MILTKRQFFVWLRAHDSDHGFFVGTGNEPVLQFFFERMPMTPTSGMDLPPWAEECDKMQYRWRKKHKRRKTIKACEALEVFFPEKVAILNSEMHNPDSTRPQPTDSITET